MKRLVKRFVLLLSFITAIFFSCIYAQQGDSVSGTGDNSTGSNVNIGQDEGSDLDLDENLNLDNLDDEELLDETGNDLDVEEDLESFGYADKDEVVVKEVGSGYVVLEAPVVNLANGDKVKQYKVYYSTESLATANVDATKIKSKSFMFDSVNDKVELRVDGLTPGTTYYAVVVPVNADDVEGNQSKEISFTTERLKDEKQQPEETHSVAEVVIENVTYVVSGNKLTVKWSPVEGANNIEIYMKAINDENYEKVATVPGSTTNYTVEVSKPGEYQVKLTPVDEEGVPVGKDYIIATKVSFVPKKPPKKAPKVGPETNFIILLMILISISYFVIRYRKI